MLYSMNQHLENLRREGITYGPVLSANQIAAIRGHLSLKPKYPGHVKIYAKNNSQSTQCFDMDSVITAPGLFKFALGFTDLAAEFLEVEPPRLYTFNGFWTYPNGVRDPGPMDLHRDNDDIRMMVLYLYCTDVLNPDDGAHLYTKRGGNQIRVCGPAGTTFITDVSQPHCGPQPLTNPRLLLWVRWGISTTPASYIWEELKPVPKERVPDFPYGDERLMKSVELVAA
jgi:hypothetical protein